MPESEPSGLLRLKRTDDHDSIVVVLMYRTGANALDLELVASEGESAWAATFQENGVRKFKAASSPASDATWDATLRAALLLEEPAGELAPELEGLEAVCTIAKEGYMSLIIRRNIGELTQRLGTITLEPTSDDKFDLWAGCAAGAQLIADTRKHANELARKLEQQRAANRKLQEQLQDLMQAKEAHEEALLHKFAELINAKKLKIRDQQRLLATAKVDPKKVNKVQGRKGSRIPEKSRISKRKVAAMISTEEDSSEGFENASDREESMPDVSTPEPLEDQDDTEDDEDNADAASASSFDINQGVGRGLTIPPNVIALEPSKLSHTAQNSALRSSQESKQSERPPPRRELPFARSRAALEADTKLSQEPARLQTHLTSAAANLDDDDTTDDEL
ncbi:uncharacterized protein PV09_09317 [Verruconis gallopava]|uniref:DNA repair protein XRCC4 n=1 Tax=Verruconis gallopava TaxID=253628 RepID=A0A0D1YDY5_9PEZI|nr:uncharacterized protein PV09_09317 [Verruconis gallopava]KIV98931.1 hypothetical protein PV09_09317 [Verruconis gallopava]